MQTFLGLTLALGLAVTTAGARAETATPWVDLGEAKVRLIAAAEGLDAAGNATLGLHIRLADGWKTYWREPGEAGTPPRLDWSDATNLADATLLYPAPHRFVAYGATSLGYVGEVVLPIRVRASDPTLPIAGRLNLDFAVCQDICILAHTDLALDLPPGRPAASEHAGLIAAHAARVPPVPDTAALRIRHVAQDGMRLVVEAVADAPFERPDLFVEADGSVGFGAPEVTLADGGRRATLTLPIVVDLAGRKIGLTLVDGDRAVTQTVTLR